LFAVASLLDPSSLNQVKVKGKKVKVVNLYSASSWTRL